MYSDERNCFGPLRVAVIVTITRNEHDQLMGSLCWHFKSVIATWLTLSFLESPGQFQDYRDTSINSSQFIRINSKLICLPYNVQAIE